jgi:integrase
MAKVGKLTAITVSSITKRGRYGDGGGLYLQVSQWGTKAWVFRYMVNGRARTMGLGDIETFTLKEARNRARDARQLLADGIDPLERRQKAKEAARLEAAHTVTFKDAAQRYIKVFKPAWKNSKHGDQWQATLDTYANPVFGDLPVSAIDTALVMKALEPIWTTKTETASRVRGRVEAILDWAKASKFRDGDNPARWRGHLDKLLPAKSKVAKIRHQPAMPYAALPVFMAKLRDNGSVSARALELCILTATRTSEAIGARWDEIDLAAELWIIPDTRMKAGREHRVPLTGRTLEILNTLPREHGSRFVFPGAGKGKPLSNMAMLELLRGINGNGFVVHGFRSSFRDWAAEQTNFPRELAEAVLGHVISDKTEAAYLRGDLLTKRRELMTAWDRYCGEGAE